MPRSIAARASGTWAVVGAAMTTASSSASAIIASGSANAWAPDWSAAAASASRHRVGDRDERGRRAGPRGSGGGCGPSTRGRRGRSSPARRRRPSSGGELRAVGSAGPGVARDGGPDRLDDAGPAPRRSGPGTSAGRASVAAAASVTGQVGVEAPLHDVGLAMDRDRVVDVGADARSPGGPRRSRRARRPTSTVYWWKTWVRPSGVTGRPHRQVGERARRSGRRSPAGGRCSARACRTGRARSRPRCRSSGSCSRASRTGSGPASPGCGRAAASRRGASSFVVTKPPSAGRHVLRRVEAERAVPEAAGAPAAEQSRRGPGRRPRRRRARGGRRSRRIMSMSATSPKRWTGQIARVRGVIAASICFASIRYVSGSMSTKTGVAPVVEDRVRRRGERVRDRDDLVARLEADAGEDRHQRRASRWPSRSRA